jgi:hypothetical protein
MFPNQRDRDRSCQRQATHVVVFREYDHAAQCPQWHVQAEARPHLDALHYCLGYANSIVAHLNAGLRRMYHPRQQEG